MFFPLAQMKLQSDVTAQMAEVQRLRGEARPAEGALKLTLMSASHLCALQFFLKVHPFPTLLCFYGGGVANRAADGAEARVHEARRAAERSEEKWHQFGEKIGV